MEKPSNWNIYLGACFAALVFGTFLCSFIYAAIVAITSSNSITFTSFIVGIEEIYVFALFFGFVPSALIGAPLFGWLHSSGRGNYLTVTAIGTIPGILALLFLPIELVFFYFGFGVFVALLSQYFVVGSETDNQAPNNSLKSDAPNRRAA